MSKQLGEDGGENLPDEPIDPFCEQIFLIATNLLENREKITIKDLLDELEEKGIQAGDSVVRERISELVDRRYLDCLPGSGRRPSYYFFPNDSEGKTRTRTLSQVQQIEFATPDDAEALQHLLDAESRLQSEVDSIQEQLNAKLDDLASVQQDIDAFRRVVRVKMRLGSTERGNNGGQK